MKTFNHNTHPNFFNLCFTNDVCDTHNVTVRGESLHTILNGVRDEALKCVNTHIDTFNTTEHPYLCKLWDLFFDNAFVGVTLYNIDCDYDEDFNSMVDTALMEMVTFYV